VDTAPLRPDPRREDLPPDASLPEVAAPGAARHPAADLELVGALGTALLAGVLLGLLALDGRAWLQGRGFSGQSLAAAGALGVTVLPVGVASWVAGWRLRRRRGEDPRLPRPRAAAAGFFALLAGALLAGLLGLPT